MRSTQTTVGTTATLLVDSDNINRVILIHAVSNTPIYLGDSAVTTSTGYLLEKDDGALQVHIPINEKLYAIVSTGTEVVTVLLPDS